MDTIQTFIKFLNSSGQQDYFLVFHYDDLVHTLEVTKDRFLTPCQYRPIELYNETILPNDVFNLILEYSQSESISGATYTGTSIMVTIEPQDCDMQKLDIKKYEGELIIMDEQFFFEHIEQIKKYVWDYMFWEPLLRPPLIYRRLIHCCRIFAYSTLWISLSSY